MSTGPGADYDIVLDRAAERDIDRLEGSNLRRVDKKILSLSANSRPQGVRKLQENIYSVRVGDYRIIYVIDDDKRKVIVSRVKRRDERTYDSLR